MSTLSEIRETIQEIAHQDVLKRTNYHVGTIVSVESNCETCTVNMYDTDWSDVRLVATLNDNANYKVVPSVGSFVMVADLSNGLMADLAVFMYSQIDRLEIGTAEHTAANADVLADQLKVLTQRVDTLYNALQQCGQDSYGGALWTKITGTLNGQTQKEDWSNIQDETIKHGAK